jgi:hypothetical protein
MTEELGSWLDGWATGTSISVRRTFRGANKPQNWHSVYFSCHLLGDSGHRRRLEVTC